MPTYIEEVVASHRPNEVSIQHSRVETILHDLGYKLVGCRQASGQVQITTDFPVSGILITTWGLRDIEKAGFRVYRQSDNSFKIFETLRRSSVGTYVPIKKVYPILEEKGYRIYTPYILTGEFFPYVLLSQVQRHDGQGYSCFSGDTLISWSGTLDGDVITYEPYIRGAAFGKGSSLPNVIVEALLLEARVTTQRLKIDAPIVTLPQPPWLKASAWSVRRNELQRPEAQRQAMEFAQTLEQKGLLPDGVVIIRTQELTEALDSMPTHFASTSEMSEWLIQRLSSAEVIRETDKQ